MDVTRRFRQAKWRLGTAEIKTEIAQLVEALCYKMKCRGFDFR
jgi:hypothetical protein